MRPLCVWMETSLLRPSNTSVMYAIATRYQVGVILWVSVLNLPLPPSPNLPPSFPPSYLPSLPPPSSFLPSLITLPLSLTCIHCTYFLQCSHTSAYSYLHSVWFEPTGVDKAGKLVHEGVLGKIHYVSPNLSELRSIHESLYGAQTSRKSITGMTWRHNSHMHTRWNCCIVCFLCVCECVCVCVCVSECVHACVPHCHLAVGLVLCTIFGIMKAKLLDSIPIHYLCYLPTT